MATPVRLLDEITPGTDTVVYEVTNLNDVEYNGKKFTFMIKVTDSNGVQFGEGSVLVNAKTFTSADGFIAFTCDTNKLAAKGANASSKFTICG